MMKLRNSMELHNRRRISQVEFLLRFNMVMFEFMTLSMPPHMAAVIDHERREAESTGQPSEVEAGRLMLESIVAHMRERFEQNRAERNLLF